MTLELSPELEREIEAAARLRGTDAPSFVRDAARRALGETLDPDAALDALLDTLLDNRAAKGLPPLDDEQLSRAAFYDEETTQ